MECAYLSVCLSIEEMIFSAAFPHRRRRRCVHSRLWSTRSIRRSASRTIDEPIMDHKLMRCATAFLYFAWLESFRSRRAALDSRCLFLTSVIGLWVTWFIPFSGNFVPKQAQIVFVIRVLRTLVDQREIVLRTLLVDLNKFLDLRWKRRLMKVNKHCCSILLDELDSEPPDKRSLERWWSMSDSAE